MRKGSQPFMKAPLALLVIVSALGVHAAASAEPWVDLRAAHGYAILAEAGISTTGATEIVGDIGVSPIASTAITGFGLIADRRNTYSTSSLVQGKIFAADYTGLTPPRLTVAVYDMQTAYTAVATRKNPTKTELGAGNIGGLLIRSGLYKWSTDVNIPTNVTLYGNQYAVWVFQIAGNLEISPGKNIILTGGAQARNIFWQVAGNTVIGAAAVFNGTILDKNEIALKTGATLNGRALAQTIVTLEDNAVTLSPVST